MSYSVSLHSSQDPKPARKAPRRDSEEAKPVPPGLVVLACLLALGISAFVSTQLSNPDEGILVQTEDIPKYRQREIERIQADTHMPPIAKRIALQMLKANPSRENQR